MPRGSEKANEFKRYRQVLAALYIGFITAGFTLLAASVVNQLFFQPDPAPSHVQQCSDRVTSLYETLSGEAGTLLASPAQREQSHILPAWATFSDAWIERWDEADKTCRFSERATDPAHGKAYQRLARVHSGLPAMRQKYQSLLVQFEEQQAADLAEMKRELSQTHALLKHTDHPADEGAR